LCGSQENLKRREAKLMLRDWEKRFPGRVENIFSSLSRVTPSHLMDRDLFDFSAAMADGVPSADGDIAFDVDPVLEAPALRALAPDAMPDAMPDGLPGRVRATLTIAREPTSSQGKTDFRPSDSEQTASEQN
jgi:hypothetical protein